MIRLIVIVAVMVAGLIFGPEASGNKGYVLISLGNYIGGILGHQRGDPGGAVLRRPVIVEWVLARLFGLRRKTQGWFGSAAAARPTCKPSMPPWPAPEGHYNQAEKLLIKGADNSDTRCSTLPERRPVAQAQR